ncbi:MAG: DUF3179 domain-containing protein [Chloroflexi bacterium]|nr:DUF3179 domain-containing protein [Chloroflexota bacterium]MBI3734248.1 DUF3179 domain-containing protein [Chloroflexota bacterium]
MTFLSAPTSPVITLVVRFLEWLDGLDAPVVAATAIIAGLLAIISPSWEGSLIRFGFAGLYNRRVLSTLLAIFALLSEFTAYALSPTRLEFATLLFISVLVMLTYLLAPKRMFIALDYPAHVSAAEAKLTAETPIIGLSVDEHACAWPLALVRVHHVVNDWLGPHPVLVSYCPACQTALVYSARVNGRYLGFVVAGMARRNLIMRDRETDSLWQQATGQAIAGRRAGSQLELAGGEQMSWAAWQKEHPQTEVAIADPEQPSSLLPGLTRFRPVFAPYMLLLPLLLRDRRLAAREEVVGIRVGEAARAYPLSRLRRERVVNDVLGGEPLVVLYSADADRVRAFARQVGGRVVTLAAEGDDLRDRASEMRWNGSGEPLSATTAEPLRPVPLQRTRWHSWRGFYPHTSIYSAEA